MKSKRLVTVVVGLVLALVVATCSFAEEDEIEIVQLLPIAHAIKTPKEISSLFSIVEQAAIVKTKADKKLVLGVTMPLESILSDTLASTGRSMIRISLLAVYRAIEKNIEKGVNDKKEISDNLVLLYRTGKLVSKSNDPSLELTLDKGKVVEVTEEVAK